MGSNETSGQEVTAEGRLDELMDYLPTLASSPAKSMGDFQMTVSYQFIFYIQDVYQNLQEGMSNYSEETAESGQLIKVYLIYCIKYSIEKQMMNLNVVASAAIMFLD